MWQLFIRRHFWIWLKWILHIIHSKLFFLLNFKNLKILEHIWELFVISEKNCNFFNILFSTIFNIQPKNSPWILHDLSTFVRIKKKIFFLFFSLNPFCSFLSFVEIAIKWFSVPLLLFQTENLKKNSPWINLVFIYRNEMIRNIEKKV